MQMTAIDPSATIVENELVSPAETATEIASEGTAAVTRSRERPMVMEPPQVIMAVHTEVQRVGAEAEVEKMTVVTHVATEIALTRAAAEMETITEGGVACAPGREAPVETSTVQEIVGTAMMVM
jgi:hypothetical protein